MPDLPSGSVPRIRQLTILSLLAGSTATALACSDTSSTRTLRDDRGVVLDANGDQLADDLGIWIDRDGNGVPDEVDVDGDMVPDGRGIDLDGDGEVDGVGVDTNNDGIYDAIDTDGDGTPDQYTSIRPSNGTGGSGIVIGDPTGGTGTGGSGGSGPNGKSYCQEVPVEFVPQTPTVYVLVDRSGSMQEEGFWDPLRTGVLAAIEGLSADVRFGFGAYSGTTGTCPEMTDLGTISTDNYAAIESLYSSLQPMPGGQTPTAAAVASTRELLLAEKTALEAAGEPTGDYFILLVTDGNPDFCDDGKDKCAQDALIGELQASHASGIRTLVFGLEAQLFPIQPGTLDRFANAGMGQNVAWSDALPPSSTQMSQVYHECQGHPPWAALPKASDGDTVGTYSTTSGAAKAFSSSDPTALTTEIRSVVSGLKSCFFDLGESGVEVNLDLVDQGDIFLDGSTTSIPRDQWMMHSSTQLELVGDACALWQQPDVKDFFAGFPCHALVLK